MNTIIEYVNIFDWFFLIELTLVYTLPARGKKRLVCVQAEKSKQSKLYYSQSNGTKYRTMDINGT